MSKPIVVIVCMALSSESWEPQQRPHPWHRCAGGGAVHSINSGLTHDERSGVASSACKIYPILVQDRAAGPFRDTAVARAPRPFDFYMWQSLSLSMLCGMRVRPEGQIDREWAQSLLASRAPAATRPAPDG